MKKTIARIYISRVNVSIVRNDGSHYGMRSTYPASIINIMRCTRMIDKMTTENQGVARRANRGSAVTDAVEFIHAMPSYYRPGHVWKFEYLTTKITPDLKLEINLTDAGKAELADLNKAGKDFYYIQGVLLEDMLGNGFFLDPEDDGRCFLTMAGTDDMGDLDVRPGDLAWCHNNYALRFWWDETMPLQLDPYYFGDESLDQQGAL